MEAAPPLSQSAEGRKEKAVARAALSAEAYHLRRVRSLAAQIRRRAGRLGAGADSEALHDFRVSLRRLRSVLTTYRRIHESFYVDAIRRELQAIANRTNVHRDQEVMASLLAGLEMTEESRAAVSGRLTAAEPNDREGRREFLEYLAGRPFEEPLGRLKALLALPPRRKESAGDTAGRAIQKETKRLASRVRSLRSDTTRTKAVHRTRIAAKRLRYIVDYYAPVLPKPARARARIAKKLQTVLGDVHDVDVALAAVPDLAEPGSPAETELIQALNRRRQDLSEKAERILSEAAAKLPA